MFVKVICFLLLFCPIFNSGMAIGGQKVFYTPRPVSFPASLNEQDLHPYTGQLLDFSKRGVYCLTTKITYDEKNSPSTPTLFIGPCSYSVIVTLNGLELYRWGDFKHPVSMTNFAANAIVLSNISNGENHLKFYFYSDGKSMPLPHFYVSDYAVVAKASATQTLFNLYLIQGIGIIALFSSLVFFGYSAAAKFQEHDILYFSFFAFTIFMGYGHFIMNSPTSNDLLWFKISRIGYAFAAFLLFLFSCEYTTLLTKKKWVKGAKTFFSLTLIVVTFLFFESKNQGILNERFALFSQLYILPLLFLGYFLLIRTAMKKKKITTLIILGGYSLFLLGTIHDIIFVVLEKEPYFWMTPYGYFMIITAIIYSLIFRYYHGIKIREETEALLRYSKEKYRGLIESSSDWIWEIDVQGNYIYSSPQVESILGYKADGLMGKSRFDLMPPGEAEKIKKRVLGRIASGKPISAMVNVNLHKLGHPVILEMGGRPVLEKGGKVISYRGIDRDITERKQAEDALRESEEFRKQIYESSRIPIIVMDATSYRYLDCNLAAVTVYAFSSKEEVIGKTPLDVSASYQYDGTPSKEKSIAYIITAKEKGSVVFEWKHQRPDGELWDAEVHLRSFTIGNKKLMQFSLVDITNRKRAEATREKLQSQLAQAQKMEAIGTLSSGIAHDFNNILSGIFGYSQLAKMHISDPEKVTKNVEQIVKGAQRATDLVQQILTFSRKTEHEMQPLKIFIEVKEAVRLIRSSIPSSIEIKEKINSKATISADLTQIHQVVMNLCTNAYHAMRETGGTLSVSLTEVQIPITENPVDLNILPGSYLKLEVSDTGSGMNPETLERLFEPYFTTKEPGEGTGLGLAVVLGIVEEHNGYIKAYSEFGKGSAFHVYLPVLDEQADTFEPEKEGKKAGEGTEKIMVVDDEDSIRTSTQELLEDYGYKVSVFSNGIEALNEFKKDPHQFDLIITDVTMPKMTGDELSIRLSKIRYDLPIILCSGYSKEFSKTITSGPGITKYLQKPINSETLLVLIRKILDGVPRI